MLYDTIRHVKLLESTLKHREKIISDVYQYIKKNTSLEQKENLNWTFDLLEILNQKPIIDGVDVSQSLNQIQKNELYERINSQKNESNNSWDIIRNGLKDVLDGSDFDTFLNSRDKLIKDIFEKKEESDLKRNGKYSQEMDENVDGGEIYSCDTLELNQQMIEKYGEKITQELLRRSETEKSTTISDKFTIKTSERDQHIEKIKQGSKIGVALPQGPEDGEVEAITQETKGSHPKWKSKVSLRAHIDAVRSLSFHPSEDLMVSSSEDGTVMLWQFKKLSSSSRRTPLHIYLGHTGPVLTTACSEDYIFSSGNDGVIRLYSYPASKTSHDWKELHNKIIPYNPCNVVNAHDDIIWKIALNENNGKILTASSDGFVKLWDYNSFEKNEKNPDITIDALQKFNLPDKIPTSVSFYDVSKCIVGYSCGDISCFDLETGKNIWASDLPSNNKDKAVYQLETHKLLQLGISCHEDGKLRWLDLRNSGNVVHEVAAHQEAVACLSIDASSGMYIATGGHDCRVRIWDIQTRQCLQDMSCHRSKNEEGIHDIIYHPKKQLLATAGADSQIRLFQ